MYIAQYWIKEAHAVNAKTLPATRKLLLTALRESSCNVIEVVALKGRETVIYTTPDGKRYGAIICKAEYQL